MSKVLHDFVENELVQKQKEEESMSVNSGNGKDDMIDEDMLE